VASQWKLIGRCSHSLDGLQVIDALHVCGVILHYQDKVFIRAEEVADIVVRALPDTPEEAEVRPQVSLARMRVLYRRIGEQHCMDLSTACIPFRTVQLDAVLLRV
jgi:hypothetical protein